MENGVISDGQIRASSQYSAGLAAIRGRLGNLRSWSAALKNINQWLQIDLGGQYTKITRVATQGRNDYNQWVKTYKLHYSDDGGNFHYYRDLGQSEDKVSFVQRDTDWGELNCLFEVDCNPIFINNPALNSLTPLDTKATDIFTGLVPL